MISYRWVEALRFIPPRAFWSTLVSFFVYSLRQARRAVGRERGDARLASHVIFKRAHYLEKAMLCEYPRSAELDENYRLLSAYVNSPQGEKDDCYRYLVKLTKEYEHYPHRFRCFMLDIPRKPGPATFHRMLRRIIIQRRSVRRFEQKPLGDDLIKKVVEAGVYAPTSCNAQPLQFVSLTSRAAIDLVFASAAGAKDWYEGIPAGLLILTDIRHYKPFQQHIVMYQDIAAATQNCLLMAEALDLSACWVSLLTDSHCENQDEIYRQLDLPSHLVIGAAIAIGHPANAVCLVPRRPIESMWHKDRYIGQ